MKGPDSKRMQTIIKKKFNFIKIKNFHLLEETIRKAKRQTTPWEIMFAAPITGKGLLSSIQRTCFIIINKKLNYQMRKKMRKICEHSITEEKTWVVDKHIKRISTSLVTRKMQIKLKLIYYFIPTRLTKIRNAR